MNRLLIFASTAFFCWASAASADVYVSPYKDDGEIKYSTPPKLRAAPTVDADVKSAPGVRGGNLIERQDLGYSADASSGREVPLSAALEMLYPSSGWKHHFDPALGDDPRVSWSGGGGEGGVVQAIAKQNGLYIAVNADDHTVGVSKDSDVAHLLAHKIPRVWFVLEGTDLHSLVRSWAAIAGKQVGFKVDDNYLIEYPAVVKGTFIDALNQLLASVADEKAPMIAERATNGVFTIVRGGWQAP